MKRAFTLVEIMIVTVVIGLLAAMAIPAFTKVRFNAIEKRIINEEKVSNSDRQFYQNWKARWGTPNTNTVNMWGVTPAGEVTINGVTYYLVRK